MDERLLDKGDPPGFTVPDGGDRTRVSVGGAVASPMGSAGAGSVRRCIAVRSTAEGRRAERREEKDEAGRLKAQGLPRSVRDLWAKTGNHVQSNKYTLLSFLPLALRLQFREVANIYFAFIAVFYAWEKVSPVVGLSRFSGAFSLGVVLFYGLVLEAIQDIRRWRQDQSINNAPCRILDATGSKFESRRWCDAAVGDIVKVVADQTFPADLLLLVSEHKDGLAYVETASLDGETNLKVFEAKPSIVAQGIEGVLDARGGRTASVLLESAEGVDFESAEEQAVVDRVRGMETAGAQLECELPTASLYEWSGSVSFTTGAGEQEEVSVEAKQLLLRGAVLKKTRWVVGMVVYAGVQTKLQMNDEAGQDKTTRLLMMMQRALVWLLVQQLIASLIFAAAKSIWDSIYQTEHVYLLQENDPGWWEVTRYLEHVVTFILLLCYMVPISLIMSIQTVKNIQRYFMDVDYGMYHAETNTPAVARSDKLQEELGQVNYIFSDKTGTLTCNEMELLKACVDGSTYGDGSPHGLYSTRIDIYPEDEVEDEDEVLPVGKEAKKQSLIAAGSVVEVTEVIKEDYDEFGLCFTTDGQHIGRVRLSDLKPQAEQQLNDDVGLYPLRRGEQGKTATIIAEHIANGHRSGSELDSFWTELAVCHQAEAEHPPADDELQAYREQRRSEAEELMEEARTTILADGESGIDSALSKVVQALMCELDEYPVGRDARIQYSASSPDDKALVEGAAAVGFRFLARRNGRVLVRILGELREYTIISVIPFDSDRKRMSVITELVVPEVEAACRLTAWLASHYDPSGPVTPAMESDLLKSQPLFKALHRRREKIVEASAPKTTPRVWTKGADSIMRPLLESSDPTSQRRIRQTWTAMGSSAGLRTLVISSRILVQDGAPDSVDMNQWKQDMLDSMRLPKAQMFEQQAQLFKQVEDHLHLHGSTAVEDKLQDRVTEVLPKLHAAGIAVWVLTGDKIDTATEIGYSTELLRADMNVVTIPEWMAPDEAAQETGGLATPPSGIVDAKEMDTADGIDPRGVLHIRGLLVQLLQELKEIEVSVGSALLVPSGSNSSVNLDESAEVFIQQRPLQVHPLALVIHASALTIAMENVHRDAQGHPVPSDDDVRQTAAATVAGATYGTTLELFVEVAKTCKTVVCCRVSPKQKAEVVRLGKLYLGSPPLKHFSWLPWRFPTAGAESVTLAIGDGANDVPMIKEAHIGVGISGHEGMQAVLASDFSIAQFAFLERLLLVHGHANYFRTSKLILYFMYKSVLFSLTMTWMTLYNGYSGQSIYDGNIAGGFNLLFTFFPVMLLATLDRDLDTEDLVAHPSLYAASRGGHGFSGDAIASWTLSGVWHSIVLFFGAIYVLDGVDAQGRELNFWQMGVVLFSLVHVTVHLKIALVFSSWTLFSTLTFIFSLSTWYWVWPIYSQVYGTAWTMNTELYLSFQIVHADQRFWLTMLLLPVACIGVDVALKYWWRRGRKPDAVNALRYQLQERTVINRDRDRAAAATPASERGGHLGAAADAVGAKRQQDQVRRKATADLHRASFAATGRASFAAASMMRLASSQSGFSASSPRSLSRSSTLSTSAGVSSSVLGRDDDESNRRGAEITFGKDYLLPQKQNQVPMTGADRQPSGRHP